MYSKELALLLFYKIPQRGNSSHESIVVKSNSAVYPEIDANLESQIDELETQLNEKEEELLKLDLPTPEHFLFANNTFLQEGDPVEGIIAGDQIWFVQEGYKRKINDTVLINIIRKINNDDPFQTQFNPEVPGAVIPLSLSPLLNLTTSTNINSIPEAQDINIGSDLSISPLIAKTNQEYIFSQLKVKFKCVGVEKFYKFSEEEKSLLNLNDEGFWYLDKDGRCELTYQTDLDPTETFLPETNTISFKTTKRRRISRDSSLYGLSNPLDPEFYQTEINTIIDSRPPDEFSTFYPAIPTWKEWGEGNKFPAITSIKKGSRIKIKIMTPENLYIDPTNVNNSQWSWLSGVNTDDNSVPNDLFKNFNKNSNYGTRMINNICYGPYADECYGKLHQDATLQLPETLMRNNK